MGRIEKAKEIATNAHQGQLRKWSDPVVDYIVHPLRVAEKLSSLEDVTETEVIAAILHDVKEDCDPKWMVEIEANFSQEVVKLVEELTNPTHTEEWVTKSRAEKREADWAHLKTISKSAKRIKLVDRFDNLSDYDFMPFKFLSKYIPESKILLEICKESDPIMAQELEELINEICVKYGL